MSNQPLPALYRSEGRIAKEFCGPRPLAFDIAARRLADCDPEIKRVVNIYADGRLAYTGLLRLAAIRLDISERALALSIERGLAIPQPQQPRFFQTPEGRWPRARTYRAKWRDA